MFNLLNTNIALSSLRASIYIGHVIGLVSYLFLEKQTPFIWICVGVVLSDKVLEID